MRCYGVLRKRADSPPGDGFRAGDGEPLARDVGEGICARAGLVALGQDGGPVRRGAHAGAALRLRRGARGDPGTGKGEMVDNYIICMVFGGSDNTVNAPNATALFT